MEKLQRGLYIVKFYCITEGKKDMRPYLKYGKTKDIKKRMYYYNKKGSKKLLAFFPCKEIDILESIFREHWRDEFWGLCESTEYTSGLFKSMYLYMDELSKSKIKRLRNGSIEIQTDVCWA